VGSKNGKGPPNWGTQGLEKKKRKRPAKGPHLNESNTGHRTELLNKKTELKSGIRAMAGGRWEKCNRCRESGYGPFSPGKTAKKSSNQPEEGVKSEKTSGQIGAPGRQENSAMADPTGGKNQGEAKNW